LDPSNSKLTFLDLSAELDLSMNDIHDEGGVSVADGLRANRTFQTLKLNINGLTGACAPTLALGIRSNSALCVLDLGGNDFKAVLQRGRAGHTAGGGACNSPAPGLCPLMSLRPRAR
jgi:hypothetical protein